MELIDCPIKNLRFYGISYSGCLLSNHSICSTTTTLWDSCPPNPPNGGNQSTSTEMVFGCGDVLFLNDPVRVLPGAFLGGSIRVGCKLHIGPHTDRKAGDHDG